MTDKPKKFVPALVGGAVLGVLSSIPIVALANVACCSWAIVGGALAALMLVKRSPILRVASGDGALAGMLAGLIGSVLYLLIHIPFAAHTMEQAVAAMKQAQSQQTDPQAIQMLQTWTSFAQDNGYLASLVVWGCCSLIAIGMATIGGLIGVAIFERRKSDQAPPPSYPPQNYPPGPGYGPPPGQPPYGPQGTPPPNQPPY